MLIIKKVLDFDLKEKLCNLCGVSHFENSMAYYAVESETPDAEDFEILAFLQFSMVKDCVYINNITPMPGVNDNEALIILSRTAMEFIHHRLKVDTLKIEENPYTMDILIRTLGFRKNEQNVYTIDLKRFFAAPCEFTPDA